LLLPPKYLLHNCYYERSIQMKARANLVTNEFLLNL